MSYKFKLVLIFKTVFSEDRYNERLHFYSKNSFIFKNIDSISKYIFNVWVGNRIFSKELPGRSIFRTKFVVAGCGLVGR